MNSMLHVIEIGISFEFYGFSWIKNPSSVGVGELSMEIF